MPTKPPDFLLHAIDLRQLAHTGLVLKGQTPLADLSRWQEDAPTWEGEAGAAPLLLEWQSRAEARTPPGGQEQVWLHLAFTAQVPQVCQRCLVVYLEPVECERWFRFVADEASAEAQDDDAEEDLLVWSERFDLLELIEDELLLALPLVPMHLLCPQSEQAQESADAEPSKRHNPFAVLSSAWSVLRRTEPGAGT